MRLHNWMLLLQLEEPIRRRANGELLKQIVPSKRFTSISQLSRALNWAAHQKPTQPRMSAN